MCHIKHLERGFVYGSNDARRRDPEQSDPGKAQSFLTNMVHIIQWRMAEVHEGYSVV
ncbi:MAG: hypothetical protein AMXMBFR82_04520 [Candidatus Hydrogenedentota bacterium]